MYALRKSWNIRGGVPAISVAIQFAIESVAATENHPAAQKKCGKASSSRNPTVSRERLRSGSRIAQPDRAVTHVGAAYVPG